MIAPRRKRTSASVRAARGAPALPARLGAWAQHPAMRPLQRPVIRLVGRRARTIRRGPAAGLRIQLEDSNLGYVLGSTERAVQTFLRNYLRSGDTFYDIGANIGFFTLLAARLVGASGWVHSFEPLPTNVARLAANLAGNGLTNTEVHEVAVYDRTGEGELMVGRSSVGSRLAEASPGWTGGTALVGTPIVALDDLVPARGLRPPTVVKVDAEGAEGGVLLGMRRLLASARPLVVCELHQESDEQVLRILDELDYEYWILERQAEAIGNFWSIHVAAQPRRAAATVQGAPD